MSKMSSDIGSAHFSQNKALYEPQRSNNFDFVISENLNGVSALGSEAKTFTHAQDYIRLSVASSSVPHHNQDVLTVRRGNTAVKYAGPMNFDSGSLSCYDFIGTETLDILMGWQAKSGDPLNQTVSQQSAYKMDAQLLEYTPDYSKVVRTWVLEGCWISQISEQDLDQDGGGSVRKISCTIQYDRAYVDYSA